MIRKPVKSCRIGECCTIQMATEYPTIYNYTTKHKGPVYGSIVPFWPVFEHWLENWTKIWMVAKHHDKLFFQNPDPDFSDFGWVVYLCFFYYLAPLQNDSKVTSRCMQFTFGDKREVYLLVKSALPVTEIESMWERKKSIGPRMKNPWNF